MNTQKKQLTLKKETLRDLTVQNSGEVKGGKKPGKPNTKKCVPTMMYPCTAGLCPGTVACA